MDNVSGRVRGILSGVLGQELAESSNVVRSETSAWDSLKHIELLFTVEDEFGIQFEQDELDSLNSLQSIVDTVEAKGNK